MKKNYTTLIVMLPILSIYESGIPSVDLGSLLLILTFFLIIASRKRNETFFFPKEWILYLIYVIVNFLIIYPLVFHYQEINYIFIRMSKYILYMYICLYCACNKIFDFEYGLKIYKKICIIAITFLCIQTIIYFVFGISINGVFYKLILLDSYAERASITSALMYRPTSIFLEPSHYFDYTMFFLIISLFKNQEIKLKEFLMAIYATIGMILSTSGQALVYSSMIWGYWLLLLLFKSNKKNIIKVITLIPLVITTSISLYRTSFVENILERLINKDTIGGNAVDARAGGFELFNNLGGFGKVFGNGYGNTPNLYFSSMSFNLFCLGIVGVIFILIIYLVCFKKSSYNYIKVLIVLFLIVSIGNTTFMSTNAAFLFSFIYSSIYSNWQSSNTKKVKLIVN